MSRLEAESSTKLRPRANTSFASFPWRRQPAVTSPPTPALSLHALIEALYPPAVHSLAHARNLASILPNHSPLPRRDILNPILSSLCSADSPTALQAAGFDIFAAYWENPESLPMSTSDRLL